MTTSTKLPGVIIAGAQKCGTTSLHFSLAAHSMIKTAIDPESNLPVKEIDFFSSQIKWKKGVAWYESHFRPGRGVSMDASPNYLTKAYCFQRMHDLVPDVKIIVCIRDPVARAYSQYNHYRQEVQESYSWDWVYTDDFLTNIQRELDRKPDCESDFAGFLVRGVYINQLNQLLQFFGRDQIYISVMDWWGSTYRDELKNILSFLHLEHEELPDIIGNRRSYTVEPLDPRAEQMLNDFYRPFNEKLFEFLGFRIPEWG